jgi:hypothetical protein
MRRNQEEAVDGYSAVTLSTLFLFCSTGQNSNPKFQGMKWKMLHDNVRNEIGQDSILI